MPFLKTLKFYFNQFCRGVFTGLRPVELASNAESACRWIGPMWHSHRDDFWFDQLFVKWRRAPFVVAMEVVSLGCGREEWKITLSSFVASRHPVESCNRQNGLPITPNSIAVLGQGTGSRTFYHRLFPHRIFLPRHFSIGQMPTWIFTHHGFLPIMFCPSGKIPTWIYTHHNFARQRIAHQTW